MTKEEFRHRLPPGMQGFVMNTRRDVFKDVRVRRAMNMAVNKEVGEKRTISLTLPWKTNQKMMMKIQMNVFV